MPDHLGRTEEQAASLHCSV